MELGLRQETLKYNKTVFRDNITHEETAEAIVPDTQPDILRILDTRACAMLRSKEADTGRVTINGIVTMTALYTPDGESVCRIETGVPFSLSAVGAELTPECAITADIRVLTADATIANPRKIVLRVVVSADVTCCLDAEMNICAGMCGDGADDVETLCMEAAVPMPVQTVEKKFIISDEFAMPQDMGGASDILSKEVCFAGIEYKSAGNKLIVRGSAEATVCYRPTSGAAVKTLIHSIEFSQIVETDTGNLEPKADISVMLTSVYIDVSSQQSGGAMLVAEIHAVAQCMIYGTRKFTYLADAYSNRRPLNAVCGTVEVAAEPVVLTFESTIKGSINAPGAIGEVFAVSPRAAAITMVSGDGGVRLRAPVNIGAVYADAEGELSRSSAVCYAEYALPAMNGRMLCSRCIAGSATYTTNGSEVQVSVTVTFSAAFEQSAEIECVASLDSAESEPASHTNRPSVVVYRPGSGDTLWSIGKRYGSTAKAIIELNELEPEENLSEGCLLLIPRVR